MAKNTKAAQKPWDKLGVSRTTYFNRKRKAKVSALVGRLGEAASAAATAKQVGQSANRPPPLVMQHDGKRWRPATSGMAKVAEQALSDAVQAVQQTVAAGPNETYEAVNRALAEHLRFVLLGSDQPMMLALNNRSRMALLAYLQKGLMAE